MDFEKFKEAIDNNSDVILPHYFNGDVKEFADSKLHLHDKFEENEVQLISRPFSVSNVSKSRYFLHFCRKEPKLIGSILYLNLGETAFLIDDIKSFSESGIIKWGEIPTIETIATAEQIFQNAQQKIKQLINQEKILKKDTDEILKLIEPLSGAKPYNDIQQIYWMLYCEIRFTLQLLKPDKDFVLSFGFDKEWLNLRKGDIPLLNLLSHTNLDEYTKSTFRNTTIIKLKELYNNYKIPEQQSKKPSIVSDSEIHIKMSPFPGKKSNNEITINNKQFGEVQNSPFDLLYYLLWFRKNYPDESTGLELHGVIPLEHINKISNNDDKFTRFSAVWNISTNKRMSNEKSKVVGDINKLLRNQYNIDFDAIVPDGEYYKLTNRFKPANIELVSFQANI